MLQVRKQRLREVQLWPSEGQVLDSSPYLYGLGPKFLELFFVVFVVFVFLESKKRSFGIGAHTFFGKNLFPGLPGHGFR